MLSRCKHSALHWVTWCGSRKYEVKRIWYQLHQYQSQLNDVLPRFGKSESLVSYRPITILLRCDHLREHLRPTDSHMYPNLTDRIQRLDLIQRYISI